MKHTSDDFVEIMCCTCSVKFKVTKDLNDFRRKDGKDFFCPVGHSMVYGKTKPGTEKEFNGVVKQMKKENKKLQITISGLKDQLETARDIIEGKNG